MENSRDIGSKFSVSSSASSSSLRRQKTQIRLLLPSCTPPSTATVPSSSPSSSSSLFFRRACSHTASPTTASPTTAYSEDGIPRSFSSSSSHLFTDRQPFQFERTFDKSCSRHRPSRLSSSPFGTLILLFLLCYSMKDLLKSWITTDMSTDFRKTQRVSASRMLVFTTASSLPPLLLRSVASSSSSHPSRFSSPPTVLSSSSAEASHWRSNNPARCVKTHLSGRCVISAERTEPWQTKKSSLLQTNASGLAAPAPPRRSEISRDKVETEMKHRFQPNANHISSSARREESSRLASPSLILSERNSTTTHSTAPTTSSSSSSVPLHRTHHSPTSPSTTRSSFLFTGRAFLYCEVLLFLFLAFLSLQQIVKVLQVSSPSQSPSLQPVSLTGGRTRTFFIFLLLIALLARAISLIFIANLDSSPTSSPLQQEWLLTALRTSPSLLFLSTYSVVILFWAQVYYAAVLVSLPLLKPTFVFVNIAAYCVYIGAAALTFLLEAYTELRFYAAFLGGVLHCVTALGMTYYGLKVSSKLSERTKQPSRKSSIIKRVLFLAVVCPLVLLARGLYSLAFGLHVISHTHPRAFSNSVWDALLFLVTEWVPSVLILVAFSYRKFSRTSPPSDPTNAYANPADYASPLVESGFNPYAAITPYMPQMGYER